MAQEQELERLVVRLVGDTKPYEKAMAEATKITERLAPAVDKTSRAVERQAAAVARANPAHERAGKALATNFGLAEKYTASLNPMNLALMAGAGAAGYAATRLLGLDRVAGLLKRSVDELIDSGKELESVKWVRDKIGVTALEELDRVKAKAAELNDQLRALNLGKWNRALADATETGNLADRIQNLKELIADLSGKLPLFTGTQKKEMLGVLDTYKAKLADTERERRRAGEAAELAAEREYHAVRMTARELADYDLALKGVDLSTREYVWALSRETELLKQKDAVLGAVMASAQKAAELQAAALERGKALTEQFATPQERHANRLVELNELLQRGAVSYATYGRAVAGADKELADATRSAGDFRHEAARLDAVLANSAESKARRAAYRDLLAGQGVGTPGFRTPVALQNPRVLHNPRVVENPAVARASADRVGSGPGGDALLARAVQFLANIADTNARMAKVKPLTVSPADFSGR